MGPSMICRITSGNSSPQSIAIIAQTVLPASAGFPRKVKPLVRLTERETAAWCIVRGIDYQVEECPMAAGNRHLGYKAALNDLERTSPGTKAAFYLGFIERMAPLLAGRSRAAVEGLGACTRCGAPTTGEVCAFCRLVETASARDLYERPSHPYTRGLMASVPRLDEPAGRRLVPIKGQPPDLASLEDGCPFQARCTYVMDRCRRENPPLAPVTEYHLKACWASLDA